ncbi:MAG TPA: DUF1127 domain-containing protein [Rhabdaerophilum sp.]|nr:DUF1127 domain-containing protein [Rhabdaerophilum sp.]
MALVPGFLTALVLAAAKAVVRFQAVLANRRAAQELMNWDHRSLKDIGLSRSDVRGALQLPLTEDPTKLLSLIAAGRETPVRRDGAGRTQPSGSVAAGKDRLGNLPSAEPALCA